MEKGTGNERKGFDLLTLIAALLIIAVAVYFRAPMLKYYGFYEPDDYYHFSVIRAAVANHFVVPLYLSISGWPAHTIISEPKGLYYLVIVPYFFLRFFGITYYTIMRYIALVFGIFDVLGAYLLARLISKDKFFDLLAMLLVALNMGDAARTSALIFRGDSFVTIFLILALVIAVYMFRETRQKRKLLLAILGGFVLSIANFVWNGAPFTTVVFLLFYILVVSFAFIFKDKRLFLNAKYMLVLFLVWFAFVSLYRYTILIMGQAFTGWHFIPIYFTLAIGLFALEYLSNRKELSNKGPYSLFVILIVLFLFIFGLLYAAFPSYIISLVESGSFLTLSNSKFAATIEELQPPSTPFLFASFGLQLFTSLPGYPLLAATSESIANDLLGFSIFVMLISAFVALVTKKKAYAKYFLLSLIAILLISIGKATSGFVKVLSFWTLLFAVSFVYLDLKVVSKEGFAKGEALIRFDYSEALLALISFLAVTAYLQMNAIRFNSLVSVPLSLFAAYTMYWLLMYAKKAKTIYYAGWVLLAVLLIEMFLISSNYIKNLAPADEICLPQLFCYNPQNPPVVQALSWLKNNSPPNSVVLTLWPDGSLVEGIANRTSVTDSVGSQNGTKGDRFAAWLFNTSPDAEFLLTPINGKPNYLFTRYAWMLETGGIYTESGIGINTFNQSYVNKLRNTLAYMEYHAPSFSVLNSTEANGINETINTYIEEQYGYVSFTNIGERTNATTDSFSFSGNGYNANLILKKENGTESVLGYLNLNNQISPFSNVILYNILTTNTTIINQSSHTKANNYTLLIVYSPVYNPKLPVNITSAFMLAPRLANSNMIKFLYECDYTSCPWDNNIAKLKLVYNNLDSKIFEIEYNDSNSTIARINYT